MKLAENLSLEQALKSAQQHGIEKLESQILLLHALGRDVSDRAWLIAHDGQALEAGSTAIYQNLCSQRIGGTPLAYLLGSQEFWGLPLAVNPQVLVPRADTETLVAWALSLPLPDNARVLDLGTGSGAIALALKHERPHWRVIAADVSMDALQTAQRNAASLNLEVTFEHSHWFASLRPALFDLIISNPPYIAEGDPHLPDLTDEPILALTSGADGLDAIREISEIAPAFLKPQGHLLLEHGYDQGERVAALLRAQGFTAIAHKLDLAGHTRCTGGVTGF